MTAEANLRTHVRHVLGAPRLTRFRFECVCGAESAWHTHPVYLRKAQAHAAKCKAEAGAS